MWINTVLQPLIKLCGYLYTVVLTVWLLQLQHQFPTSFEFSEALLHLLFTNSYSSEYGTFVYDCQRERLTNKVSDKTCSLWWVCIEVTLWFVLSWIIARFSLHWVMCFHVLPVQWRNVCSLIRSVHRSDMHAVYGSGYCLFFRLGKCSRANTTPTLAEHGIEWLDARLFVKLWWFRSWAYLCIVRGTENLTFSAELRGCSARQPWIAVPSDADNPCDGCE